MSGDDGPGLLPEFLGGHGELVAKERQAAVDLDEAGLADQVGQDAPGRLARIVGRPARAVERLDEFRLFGLALERLPDARRGRAQALQLDGQEAR